MVALLVLACARPDRAAGELAGTRVTTTGGGAAAATATDAPVAVPLGTPWMPPVGPAASPAPREIAAVAGLEVVGRGFRQPVALVQAPGDPLRRLFVVEKVGRVRWIEAGRPSTEVYLDLSARVSRGAEQGLLGMAFHPRFAENGRLFVNYTDRKGHTHVVELHAASAGSRSVDPSTERDRLFVRQPYANHNGGHLAFAPDGALWVGLGDGGLYGDPRDNAQDRTSLLGKMLRLVVDGSEPRPEIVKWGLRNPWRYSFDRKTGDLYIGDVGQDRYEEIHVLPAESIRLGENLGWPIVEGRSCYRPRDCVVDGLEQPALVYAQPEGCSVIGGHVYRGTALPEIDGHYLYGDYCTGLLRGFRWEGRGRPLTQVWDWKAALDPEERLAQISSFGEDLDGELYLLSLDGSIRKLVRRGP